MAKQATTRTLALTSKAKMPKAAKVAAAAPVAAPVAAPAAPVAAPVVALRGGPAVQQVKLTGKLYRSAAKHNTDWWTQIGAHSATSASGTVAVTELVKAGVPTHFIGYTMRRGYLAAA